VAILRLYVSNLEREAPNPFVARHVAGTLEQMNALWVTLLLSTPWLAAIAYTWSRVPRMDRPPPSQADRTRERLWA
jgi:hypothetical protein